MKGDRGRLYLLGAGGHGRVAADLAEQLGWRDIVFLDDGFPERRQSGAWPIVGRLASASDVRPGEAVFVSLGDNATRLALSRKLAADGKRAITLAHPAASVSPHADVGPGVLIAAGAVVGPFVVLGEAVIVNTAATIDHDCQISDGVHVSPGANLAGGVRVGEGAWIGIGASVREGISIGAGVMVGAGAAVVCDIPADSLALGVPARAQPRSTGAC